MTAETRVLRAGQWLAMENQIGSLREFRYGWRMEDTTGSTYRQPDYPEGLHTEDEPWDGLLWRDHERTPWPVRTWPIRSIQ